MQIFKTIQFLALALAPIVSAATTGFSSFDETGNHLIVDSLDKSQIKSGSLNIKRGSCMSSCKGGSSAVYISCQCTIIFGGGQTRMVDIFPGGSLHVYGIGADRQPCDSSIQVDDHCERRFSNSQAGCVVSLSCD